MIINSSIRFLQTDQQEGFGYQTLDVIPFNKFTDKKELPQIQVQQELPDGTATISNNPAVNEDILSFSNIRDLLQDDQMFRLDCDPTFFESMNIEDNFNNNLGLEHIKDLELIYNSDSWIPAPAELEIFSELPDSLFESDMMEKKEPTPPPSPIPAPPSPVVEAVEVKSENKEFDLIKYIIFGGVSSADHLEFAQFLNDFHPQDAELLTPSEEKSCPTFEAPPVIIKTEPEPSTSAAPSPKPTEVKSSRRRAPKRRYSSDSDFSVVTSASSFNATSQRSSKKKRGRPAKELITDLPTIDDFSHMPIEHASHLVLRIKNNEASRKSRMKSKSKQTHMEDECDRLEARQRRLRTKKNKLDGQIETLRRWLLGLN